MIFLASRASYQNIWYVPIQALENVEEAINRLEVLLQELHLSNSSTGKEHLEAACSDLQKIRKLKKEAEFLEASFRAKAASLEEVYFPVFEAILSKAASLEYAKI